MKLKLYSTESANAHALKLALEIKRVIGLETHDGFAIVRMAAQLVLQMYTQDNPLILEARYPEHFSELREFCTEFGVVAELCDDQ